jgi:hypothetical protein
MSKIEVNQISSQCGSTLTIGQSGDTVTLACGATQTGFGRTGTVDWCTTAKTAPFTGVSGNGYFVNTTCGAVTVTLPATPTAGDIISIADYASTFQTNNLTLCRNGSLINGGAFNAALSTQGQSITLVYVDGTKGWKNTMDSTSNVSGTPNFIAATGGTITTSGDYKIHTFTADGTFTICSAPTPANNNVSYMVVAGGASGGLGGVAAGGGGAGGYREGKVSTDPYTASPLDSTAGLPVSVQAYPITVGGGGGAITTVCNAGNPGNISTFSTITSAGGGGGGAATGAACSPTTAQAGGSGGGAMGNNSPLSTGAAGNTPPVSPAQGFRGGNAQNPPSYQNTGGGGGATAQGQDKTSSYGPTGGAGGNGGAGATTSITGSPVAYAGGGGGSADTRGGNPAAPSGAGGTGGGGAGANFTCAAGLGTTNTGGGGGGGNGPGNGGNPVDSGAGGSGIVIIRYKFQ